jgi:hypothetical protein
MEAQKPLNVSQPSSGSLRALQQDEVIMQNQNQKSYFNLINQNAIRQSKSDANLINSQLQQTSGILSSKKRNEKQAAKKQS